jgi:hypothetical protein
VPFVVSYSFTTKGTKVFHEGHKKDMNIFDFNKKIPDEESCILHFKTQREQKKENIQGFTLNETLK